MVLPTLDPHRHPASSTPAPHPRRGAVQPLLRLPPRPRLAGGARPLNVAVAISGPVNEARSLGQPPDGPGEGEEMDLASRHAWKPLRRRLSQRAPAPARTARRAKAYMKSLVASPPDQEFWEAGGNCNLAFAAARLGLRCSTLGHVGADIYGKFLLEVLEAEGISVVGILENNAAAACHQAHETHLCRVLVDPFQRHGFCSRADFGEEPASSWIHKLPAEIKKAIRHSKILCCNGYALNDFSPDVIASAVDCVIDAGTAVFFDPGPRGKSLLHGTLDEQRVLDHALRLSDVLLLTSDEAESLTDIRNPIQAGQELLKRGIRTKQVVIKMGSNGSIMITENAVSCAPSFKINVVDTVGCGDSFTAAIARAGHSVFRVRSVRFFRYQETSV